MHRCKYALSLNQPCMWKPLCRPPTLVSQYAGSVPARFPPDVRILQLPTAAGLMPVCLLGANWELYIGRAPGGLNTV